MLVKNELEADAILGLLLLKYNGKIDKKREYNYKFKSGLQVSMLKKVFKMTQYPSTDTRLNIAILLDMQPRTIQIWFQNMRQAVKEESPKDVRNEDEQENVSENATNSTTTDSTDSLKEKYAKKRIINGQYQSYEIPSVVLIEIYLGLKTKTNNRKIFYSDQ